MAKITLENKAVDLKAYPYDIVKENNVLYDHDNSINIRIEDREYTETEIFDILKKHKEEEDKKYHKCERCGKRYLENNTFNMVTYNLDKKPDNCSAWGSAWGYETTPYITGFKILSTCGQGREINLCDNCIQSLIEWLNKNK
jgi:hypothetical protein